MPKNYKICVYAIAKNEEKFVDRFMDRLEEIKDHVYILDTGSTDNTYEKFKERGAHIQKKEYEKFDFAQARNDALNLIPEDYDICICLDLDDCIEPGFIEKIISYWEDDLSMLTYNYWTTVNAMDEPVVRFQCGKIHSRKDYYWLYPIHEVLMYSGQNEKKKDAPDIIVKHRPDCTKSRAFYLDMLEDYVEKNPENRRNIYLLAREYKSRKIWEKCIKMSHRYLNLQSLPNKEELGQVMSFLTKSYTGLKYYEEAELWGYKTLKEVGDCRTPYIDMMILYYNKKNYVKSLKYGLDALNITKRNASRTEDRNCWNETVYDYISLSYYHLKDYDNALKYIDMAIERKPDDKRLIENRKIYEKKLVNSLAPNWQGPTRETFEEERE